MFLHLICFARLDNHESAKVPRSPVTSELLPTEATQAIEKASTVRLLATKKKGYPKEEMLKVPGSALYAEGSTGATDVLLANDVNGSHHPVLGDRVVNLCCDSVPFGARGTVVGIHEASTTGSVEVVMDEEFVGGTTLQGHCSNFRGKLCLWSSVLKIAASNETANEKPAPAPASQKGVAKTILSKERTEAVSRPKPKSTTRSNAQTTPPRPASSGRMRQGTWREAKGPPEKGNGFRRPKKGHSGLEKWKQQRSTHSATEDLKLRLGIAQLGTSETNGHNFPLPANPSSTHAAPFRQEPVSAAANPANPAEKLLAILSASPEASFTSQANDPFNFKYRDAGAS